MSSTLSNNADDLYARAIANHRAGRLSDAAVLYKRTLALNPSRAEAHYNLANILASQRKFGEAIVSVHQAIALKPGDADMHVSLGYMFTVQGRIEDALAAYRHALAIQPDSIDAHFQIGSVLSEHERIAEGFDHYMQRARLIYGRGKTPPLTEPQPPHRIKHDHEQREYLSHIGIAATESRDLFHLEDGSRLAGPAVNPANATADLLGQWDSAEPQFVVIENFLMPEALEKLRLYCAGSTIWRRNYRAGYIGATPEDGLASPLVAQITEEIRSIYRSILAPHPFRYLGAFKYDSELSTGTNTHADNSAVNVNFYIAHDEANLDPESGGMDIWDVAMPLNIDMRIYNGNEAAARDYLKRAKARKYVIPHRSNRAVIFKSDLFHKTGECHFADGYLNKRINVSLLFGNRGAPTHYGKAWESAVPRHPVNTA